MSHPEQQLPSANRTIDICGDVCPITFAKTKIALEEMEMGHVLRVLVDYEPASRNVPRSAEMYGDMVLHVGAAGEGQWEIWIKKLVP